MSDISKIERIAEDANLISNDELELGKKLKSSIKSELKKIKKSCPFETAS